MVKSPNRVCTNYVYALVGHIEPINDKGFKKIAEMGNCKLSNKQKNEIYDALEKFLLNEAISQQGYTRQELYKILEKIRKAASTLDEIFGDTQQNHAKRAASFKIDDEFENTIDDIGFELSARWDLVQKNLCGNLSITNDDHINFEYFADNCLIISHAATKAMEKLNLSNQKDSGGLQTEDSKDNLFITLEAIYTQTTGKKGAAERFIIECMNHIPKEYRPSAGQAGSIMSRIGRIKNRSS